MATHKGKNDKPTNANARPEANIEANESGSVNVASSKEDFEKLITDAGSKVVLVEFYAPWCGPCKLFGSKLEELAGLYNGKAIVIKVDVDDLEELAIEYDVTSMPTFMFMKEKRKIELIVGSSAADKVEKMLEKFCGGDRKDAIMPEPPSTSTTAPRKSILKDEKKK